MLDTQKYIIVKNARENNLQELCVNIPKNKLVVMTGVSGSGKSSLAFKTIYEEGNRRYMDSLSSYARQFLGNAQKPDVDSIDGLSPAISIEQKTTHNNPRSTVGTITEIHDYLRLLFARIGKPFCPNHKIEISGQKIKDIINSVEKIKNDTRIVIYSPIIRSEKGTHSKLFLRLKSEGFVRLRIDGETFSLDEPIELDKNKRHDIDIIIDRVVKNAENTSRIHDAIEAALLNSNGFVTIENLSDNKSETFSRNHSCQFGDFEMTKIEPRLFSFNSPSGMCFECKGLGVRLSADKDLLMPNKKIPISYGGIVFYKNMVGTQNIMWQQLIALLKHYKIPIDDPIESLSNKDIDIIMNGSDEEIQHTLKSTSGKVYPRFEVIEGIGSYIERMYIETTSEAVRKYYRGYLSNRKCVVCNGHRHNPQALAVRVGNMNIAEVSRLPIDEALNFVETLHLNEEEMEVSVLIRKELLSRLGFLKNVGLNYLALDRTAETLSGGEAQRIRLATQIGSNLTGVLYVLDEPSIGLHQKDNAQLITTLKKMRDIGNTLIVVEHDEETIKTADWIIDIGPLAGSMGGKLVAEGTVDDIIACPESITGKYLSKEWSIGVPTSRRTGIGRVLEFKGVTENNLKNINVKVPLGKFVVITGVSGSGKSTLVNEVITKTLVREISNPHERPGKYVSAIGVNAIDKVVRISQSPIGRTPRSNPATYTTVFDDIRKIFASTVDAKERGYTNSRFSFNVKGGRCDKCQGDGSIKIEMHFLPDVYVSCNHCDGKRYNSETLEVRFKRKNIAEVLSMSVTEAIELFINNKMIRDKLQTIADVGLGYILLGQSATTLSGGEAQRVKLATYLQKKPTGRTVFVLDEPTTGLHPYDVQKLITVLNRLVENGDTVLVIEHNLDVIKQADYIIDLGPDGGVKGGHVVAHGTPEQIISSKNSYTAQYLKEALNGNN